jgi:hypothetical protein
MLATKTKPTWKHTHTVHGPEGVKPREVMEVDGRYFTARDLAGRGGPSFVAAGSRRAREVWADESEQPRWWVCGAVKCKWCGHDDENDLYYPRVTDDAPVCHVCTSDLYSL